MIQEVHEDVNKDDALLKLAHRTLNSGTNTSNLSDEHYLIALAFLAKRSRPLLPADLVQLLGANGFLFIARLIKTYTNHVKRHCATNLKEPAGEEGYLHLAVNILAVAFSECNGDEYKNAMEVLLHACNVCFLPILEALEARTTTNFPVENIDVLLVRLIHALVEKILIYCSLVPTLTKQQNQFSSEILEKHGKRLAESLVIRFKCCKSFESIRPRKEDVDTPLVNELSMDQYRAEMAGIINNLTQRLQQETEISQVQAAFTLLDGLIVNNLEITDTHPILHSCVLKGCLVLLTHHESSTLIFSEDCLFRHIRDAKELKICFDYTNMILRGLSPPSKSLDAMPEKEGEPSVDSLRFDANALFAKTLEIAGIQSWCFGSTSNESLSLCVRLVCGEIRILLETALNIGFTELSFENTKHRLLAVSFSNCVRVVICLVQEFSSLLDQMERDDIYSSLNCKPYSNFKRLSATVVLQIKASLDDGINAILQFLSFMAEQSKSGLNVESPFHLLGLICSNCLGAWLAESDLDEIPIQNRDKLWSALSLSIELCNQREAVMKRNLVTGKSATLDPGFYLWDFAEHPVVCLLPAIVRMMQLGDLSIDDDTSRSFITIVDSNIFSCLSLSLENMAQKDSFALVSKNKSAVLYWISSLIHVRLEFHDELSFPTLKEVENIVETGLKVAKIHSEKGGQQTMGEDTMRSFLDCQTKLQCRCSSI